MDHPLRCRCGRLDGRVSHPEQVNRAVCYCRDCQAFAHFLGEPGDVLDELGGTDLIQTLPRYVRFTAGVESLACMSLSDRGLLRWYADCCRTPIGNTPRDFRLSFVGLFHACLRAPGESLGPSFGPVRMRVFVKGARATPPSLPWRSRLAFLPLLPRLLRARLDGSYRRTPFFHADSGVPVATPTVLSAEQREHLMRAVSAGDPPRH